MVDQQKVHVPYFSPGALPETFKITNLRQATSRFELTQNLSSGFVKWGRAVVIISTAWHHFKKWFWKLNLILPDSYFQSSFKKIHKTWKRQCLDASVWSQYEKSILKYHVKKPFYNKYSYHHKSKLYWVIPICKNVRKICEVFLFKLRYNK